MVDVILFVTDGVTVFVTVRVAVLVTVGVGFFVAVLVTVFVQSPDPGGTPLCASWIEALLYSAIS